MSLKLVCKSPTVVSSGSPASRMIWHLLGGMAVLSGKFLDVGLS